MRSLVPFWFACGGEPGTIKIIYFFNQIIFKIKFFFKLTVNTFCISAIVLTLSQLSSEKIRLKFRI